jgi:hypothetical protein
MVSVVLHAQQNRVDQDEHYNKPLERLRCDNLDDLETKLVSIVEEAQGAFAKSAVSLMHVEGTSLSMFLKAPHVLVVGA